jgi:hypothetical protein
MVVAAAAVMFFGFVPSSWAALIGTTPLPAAGTSVIPGLVTASPGTLLATAAPTYTQTTNAGTTSGTVYAAVYRETGGTLDFYYQIANNASSATAIAESSDVVFTLANAPAIGFRVDGGSLTGTGFTSIPAGQTSGTPVSGDEQMAGTTVDFLFSPPAANDIAAGTRSAVLVISTNATNYTTGQTFVIDGISQTVQTFQPAAGVPEPGSMLLMGLGMIGLAGIRRFRR